MQRCGRPRSVAMLAIDTDIIVRYVVGDGGEQFGRAIDILENNEVSIASTAVLETEWVLRDAYEFAREDVLAALEKVFGLPTVMLRDQPIVRKAMNLLASGMDFADALHLAQAGDCEAFVTFDRRLVRKAKGLIDIPVKPA
jgi:predicted nucleic-acid-binding protein